MIACKTHSGVFITADEPCHLCVVESQVRRENESTRRERFMIALLQSFQCRGACDAEMIARVAVELEKAYNTDPVLLYPSIDPEPAPDELPVLDDRRIIMTRAQLTTLLGRAMTTRGLQDDRV